jgi:hypothetical protein
MEQMAAEKLQLQQQQRRATDKSSGKEKVVIARGEWTGAEQGVGGHLCQL